MSLSRTLVAGLAITVSLIAAGCSAIPGGEDGSAKAKVDETVRVWVDQNGPFTCPPESPLTTSNPPMCAANPLDRVRLSGHPLFAFLAEGGWQQPSAFGTWIGTARIVGRSVDDGVTIELESIERT